MARDAMTSVLMFMSGLAGVWYLALASVTAVAAVVIERKTR